MFQSVDDHLQKDLFANMLETTISVTDIHLDFIAYS
jgi:hypothetical protein